MGCLQNSDFPVPVFKVTRPYLNLLMKQIFSGFLEKKYFYAFLKVFLLIFFLNKAFLNQSAQCNITFHWLMWLYTASNCSTIFDQKPHCVHTCFEILYPLIKTVGPDQLASSETCRSRSTIFHAYMYLLYGRCFKISNTCCLLIRAKTNSADPDQNAS